MAFTKFDSNTALIVIDLQEGILGLNTCHPSSHILEKSAQIVHAFRKKNKPVVLVNVVGSAPGRNEMAISKSTPSPNWATLSQKLNPKKNDIYISKKNWGAFIQTDLKQQLDQKGITQVVIIGIATSLGVESTARQAFELGYNVSLITDAMTDLNLETHQNSISNIFPKLGETGTAKEFLKLFN